eukprot:TRINITY_DN34633_c0_g1_i1.p1 TRINITY_DN34633_c0_g1~~TRINITY_DN34633_c0_g1_i1.p1  ORF type:complete len:308 (+),score=34.48 TRINITY_DN34633_c0_g1_i1:43-966(+)
MAPRSVATVVECLMCKSHLALKIAVLDPESFRPILSFENPADLQSDWLVDHQEKITKRQYTTAICPYCVSIGQGLNWAQWLESHEDAYLQIVRFVEFEEGEGAPLYLNDAPKTANKPKWKICQGVGPQTLELDSSRSYKIYKKSYRGSGLDGSFIDSVEIRMMSGSDLQLPADSEVRALCSDIQLALWKIPSDKVGEFLHVLDGYFSPFLLNFDEVRVAITALLDDPFHGITQFLETYVVTEEVHEEKPEPVHTSHKKHKPTSPPPAMRENRSHGVKREARRRLDMEMMEEYGDYSAMKGSKRKGKK